MVGKTIRIVGNCPKHLQKNLKSGEDGDRGKGILKDFEILKMLEIVLDIKMSQERFVPY